MTKRTSKKTASAVSTLPLNDGHVAIVDTVVLPFLQQYKWRAVLYHKSFYARIDRSHNGYRFSVSMHRLIANTPAGLVCHHQNRNSLDNRRANLCNMSKNDHKRLHMNDNLLVKFKEPTVDFFQNKI